ncbi:RICIN domain-containing protein [Actinomadura sp. ATCC 31491]|uniref:RICIN domain-containing protein n=1 Tax=Actinomadura luzonensis TaxID=2805427 RepID=A0ABT0G1F5_9ACTN|nr:RICIN domain-containing protein [Actinomadura luzonensis]MCK2218238.1 RICIN domain-containing protein [Actinomadura luzonensis]
MSAPPTATVNACTGRLNQGWVHAADASLRLKDSYCLTADGTLPGSAVSLRDCHGLPPDGRVTDVTRRWRYDPATRTLHNLASGLCLTATGQDTATTLRPCRQPGQTWTLPTAGE